MPNKNRDKGHRLERKLMNEYKQWFENCKTSRNESHERDNMGVDLCGTGMFNIQAKCYGVFSGSKIEKTLKEMPDEGNINLLHLKLDRKSETVSMLTSDWYQIVQILKSNGII